MSSPPRFQLDHSEQDFSGELTAMLCKIGTQVIFLAHAFFSHPEPGSIRGGSTPYSPIRESSNGEFTSVFFALPALLRAFRTINPHIKRWNFMRLLRCLPSLGDEKATFVSLSTVLPQRSNPHVMAPPLHGEGTIVETDVARYGQPRSTCQLQPLRTDGRTEPLVPPSRASAESQATRWASAPLRARQWPATLGWESTQTQRNKAMTAPTARASAPRKRRDPKQKNKQLSARQEQASARRQRKSPEARPQAPNSDTTRKAE